jgi:hypothetical protein
MLGSLRRFGCSGELSPEGISGRSRFRQKAGQPNFLTETTAAGKRLGPHEIAHTEKKVVHPCVVGRHVESQESVGTLQRGSFQLFQLAP